MKHLVFLFCLFFILQSCHNSENKVLITENNISVHQPNLSPTDTLNVAFLIVDGVYNTEFTAAYDIFHHTIFRDGIKPMKVFSIALEDTVVTTFEGVKIIPDYDIKGGYPPIDILAVPSAEHHLDRDLENETLISWVKQAGDNAQYVISFCDGAFVLAKAGLLNGLRCTTFPSDIDKMKETFPDLDIYKNVLWVHDGKVINSSGGARSFEPALYLCEMLYGSKVSIEIGQGMVIYWNVMNYSFLSPFGDNQTATQ